MSMYDSKAAEDDHGWYFNLDVEGFAPGISGHGYRVLESDIEMMWKALQEHRLGEDPSPQPRSEK